MPKRKVGDLLRELSIPDVDSVIDFFKICRGESVLPLANFLLTPIQYQAAIEGLKPFVDNYQKREQIPNATNKLSIKQIGDRYKENALRFQGIIPVHPKIQSHDISPRKKKKVTINSQIGKKKGKLSASNHDKNFIDRVKELHSRPPQKLTIPNQINETYDLNGLLKHSFSETMQFIQQQKKQIICFLTDYTGFLNLRPEPLFAASIPYNLSLRDIISKYNSGIYIKRQASAEGKLQPSERAEAFLMLRKINFIDAISKRAIELYKEESSALSIAQLLPYVITAKQWSEFLAILGVKDTSLPINTRLAHGYKPGMINPHKIIYNRNGRKY